MDDSSWVDGSGRKLVAALLGGWPLLAVAIVALAGTAYLYAKAQPPTYKASARMFLNAEALAGDSGQDVARLVSTQADLAFSTPVLSRISKRLDVPIEVVQDRLAVVPAAEAYHFRVDGTGESPEAAADLVIAAEEAYQEVVSAQEQSSRQAALDALVAARTNLTREYDEARAQLAKAPENLRQRLQVEILAQQLRTLRERQGDALIGAQAGSAVQLVEAPQLPTAPAAPKPLWSGVVGGLLGAMIGVAFLWWRSDRFAVAHQPAIASDLLGIPVLGQVRPRQGLRFQQATAGTDPDIVQLAVAIELAGRRQLGRNPGVLGLTDSDAPGSVPTVILDLASALASAGRRVLLADGIQHQPLIASLTAQGLLPPNLQGPPAAHALNLETDDVSVLPLGLDGRPGQVAKAHAALADAGRDGNLVILLTPAPNTPQAALLVAACEALVLVARPSTRLATLVATKARLDDLDRPILGLIFEKTTLLGLLVNRRRRRQVDYPAQSTGLGPSWNKERRLEELQGPPMTMNLSEATAGNGGSSGTRSRIKAQGLEEDLIEQDPSGVVGMTPWGWRQFTEPRFDFGIAVPPEWKPVEGRAGVIVFYDPRTDTLVSIECAQKPEASEHPPLDYDEDQYQDYERIKLESILFKGLPAIDWEFTHSESGTRLRVTDLRLFLGDFVYRMSIQSPETVWPDLRPTLHGIRDSLSIGTRRSV